MCRPSKTSVQRRLLSRSSNLLVFLPRHYPCVIRITFVVSNPTKRRRAICGMPRFVSIKCVILDFWRTSKCVVLVMLIVVSISAFSFATVCAPKPLGQPGAATIALVPRRSSKSTSTTNRKLPMVQARCLSVSQKLSLRLKSFVNAKLLSMHSPSKAFSKNTLDALTTSTPFKCKVSRLSKARRSVVVFLWSALTLKTTSTTRPTQL
mmetsp:Transcript_16719/g.24979  ORF Transcript_16719/g.24979 Transcript_16719/m.24979 type:complete len:207 (+) Transcript_16719:1943-2563(+)